MVTRIPGERRQAALVAVRGGAMAPRLRRLSAPLSRCRPGDLPTWVSLDLSAGQADELRAAGAAAGVSLDAWLAVMIEFSISLPVLGSVWASVNVARTRLSCRVEMCPVDVAPLPEWRAWQSSLSRRAVPARDELPEVVLPQRLVVRSRRAIDISSALELAGDWELARACELVACGRGQTLEAFVLEAGLSGDRTCD